MAKAKRDVGAEIKAANKNVGKLLAAGNAAGIAACYTKTAVVMPPGSKPLKGHKAIAAAFQGFMNMGVKGLSLRTVSLDVQGTTAIEYGAYTLKGDKGAVMDTGKYIVIWKREGKTWMLHWDIFNTNGAPAA